MNILFARSGFTLIEIVVTLCVITFLIGAVTVNHTQSDYTLLAEEAERLAWTLESAGDKARKEGSIIGFTIHDGKFHFWRSSDGLAWNLIEDAPLQGGALGNSVHEERVTQNNVLLAANEKLVFLPGGDSPLFSITLVLNNERQFLGLSPLGSVEVMKGEER